MLCECETGEEAWQLCGDAETRRDRKLDRGAARLVLSLLAVGPGIARGYWLPPIGWTKRGRSRRRPIPKEIVEESKMQAPEFEPPVCPKCGAGDPVLEGVDPFNSWLCEACGNEWTESGAAGSEEAGKGQK